jgi:predicted CXXCH cytochrome family protein
MPLQVIPLRPAWNGGCYERERMPRIRALPLFVISLTSGSAHAKGDGCITDVCHTEINKAKFLHGPIGAGSCRVCHPPRLKGVKGPGHAKGEMSIPLAQRPLCLKCHSSMKKELALKVVHKPVGKVSCGFCHDPHGSPNMYTLRRSRATDQKKSFCFWCHRESGFRGKHLHKPVAGGKCTGCHAVHASSARGLLVKEQPRLCIDCHKLKWHERKVVHGPVASGLCAACHPPHAAPEPRMLKLPRIKLCPSCHQQRTVDKSHQNVKSYSKDCLGCHDAHATNRQHLLKN